MTEPFPLTGLAPDFSPASDGAVLDSLAERAADGDRAAFGELYELLVDDLYRYLRGQCHDDTLAEDLVANVFLKAWRSAKSYHKGSGHFRRWIFTIARNELRNHWRTTQRTLEVLENDLAEPGGWAPRDNAEAARQLVAKAMAVLTQEQRDVVVLRYFENKTHEQIGVILGKREGAVRALLLRALRRMRKVMGDAAI